MVGCVPAARGFWKGSVLPSKLYGTFGTLRSRLISARTSRASSKHSAHSIRSERAYQENYDIDRHGPVGSVNDPGTKDTYVLIESARGSKNKVDRSQV